MFTLGIDIGSTTSKCILLKDGIEVIAKAMQVGGIGTDKAFLCISEVIKEAGNTREEVEFIVATGYGRTTFSEANEQLSELSCHAKGVHALFPEVRTIIDIGGQDAKVMRLSEKGRMENFLMNDKCAAGTGRFLDVMANVFQLPIQELEQKAKEASEAAKISSTCTVFAESEVISQLAAGVKLDNIIAGICNSVASRVGALVKRIGVVEGVFMSGGVAQNGGVRKALEKEIGTPIQYSDLSQYMGALGAAVYAFEKANKEV